jgi:putative ABC transport system permease protein
MIKNYIIASVRTLIKNRIYTLISVLGLALGLAMGLFSMAYLVRELSWEDCHENRSRIYRVEMQYQHIDTVWSSARVMAPLGNEIVNAIPGIEKAAVFRHNRRVSLRIDRKKYQAGHLIYAQPEFLDVFTFPLKTGDPATSLKDPKTVLITDTIARTYFPDQNPIGQTIILDDKTEFRITGILENIPRTTQLHCDFVASYSTLRAIGANLDSWTDSRSDLTYLLMDDVTAPEAVEAQIADVFARHVTDDVSQRYTFTLRPLNDIYFSTYFTANIGELYPGWEPYMIIFLVGIGLFILIQSVFNFISLSTARAADRMKEVGIRKTFGASRTRLVVQFLGESLIVTSTAMIIGLFFFEIIKIGYDAVALSASEKTYELADLYGEPGTVLLLILMTIVVAVLAGFYPALYLSRLKPISMLKDGTSGILSKSKMRKTLAVFQFTLAIFFITVSFGLYHQQNHITDYELGFDRTNMMVLRFFEDDLTAGDCAIAKSEVLARNDVLGAARTHRVLGSRSWSTVLYTNPERDESDRKYAKYLKVDYDFLSFYMIDLIEGRGFSPDRPEDIDHAIIINESMKKELKLSHPIGQRLYTDSASLEIIGVVRDFQGTALDWSYRAASIIFLDPDMTRVLCVKLKPENISGSIAAIKSTWEETLGDHEFDYSFLDEDIRTQYRELDSMKLLFAALATMSVIIACLGIFGLVSHTVERKTKETAIRKVLGASITAIYRNHTKEFVILIALANLIASPLAYLLITPYLQQYAFQASLGVGTYTLGGILTGLLALSASAYHVTKAALANPTEALKCE